MEKENLKTIFVILIILGIILIVVGFVDATNYNITESFDNNVYNYSSGDNYKIKTLDNEWFFYVSTSVANFSNDANTLDGSTYANEFSVQTHDYMIGSGYLLFPNITEYDYIVNTNTRIIFDVLCENYALYPTSYNGWFGFSNMTNNSLEAYTNIPSYVDSSFFWYMRYPPTGYTDMCQGGVIMINNTCDETYNHVTFSVSQALDNDSDCTFIPEKPVNSFRFTFINFHDEGSSDSQFIDNIQIYNLTRYPKSYLNKLPEFQSIYFNETDRTLCVNDTKTGVTFYFNVSITDDEENQILYANPSDLIDTSSRLDFLWLDFSKYRYTLSIPIVGDVGILNDIDYTFENYLFYPYEETCRLNKDVTNITADSTEFSVLGLYELKGYVTYGMGATGDYWLYLRGACSGTDKQMYFSLSKYYTWLGLRSRIKTFSGNTNITFYDDTIENKLLQLKFNKTESGTNVYNVVNETEYLIRTETENSFFIDMGIDLFGNETFYLTTGENSTYNDSIVMNQNGKDKPIKYMVISVSDDAKTAFREFIFSGETLYYDFLEAKPNNVTIKGLGAHEISIIYTDNIHEPFEYKIERFRVQIDDCTMMPEYNYNLEPSYSLCPEFFNDNINGIMCIFRVPYIFIKGLDSTIFSMLQAILVFAMLFGLYINYQKQKDSGKTQEEIIKGLFIFLGFEVFILYFLMLLIPKSIFVIFSVILLLLLSSMINGMFGVHSTDFNKNLLLSTSFFGLLNVLYFKFMQTMIQTDFGVPTFPTGNITLTTFPNMLMSIVDYVYKLLFFSIPDIPYFLNAILIFIRVISVIMFMIFVYNAINPVTEG